MLKRAVLAALFLSTTAYADDAVTTASPPVAVTALAVTQPLPAPTDYVPAPPPPQNEAWSNVSHINGVPVPVGERNRYLYAYKKTNIQTNPIGWMLGYYQIAASRALSSNVALSVELSYSSTNGGDDTSTQLAASLPIYFKRTFSGPFLEPGLLVRSERNGDDYDYECDGGCTGSSPTTSFVAAEMMLGWSWMFDSGLNMSAAFGVAKRVDHASDGEDDDDDLEPAGYFRVGYAF